MKGSEGSEGPSWAGLERQVQMIKGLSMPYFMLFVPSVLPVQAAGNRPSWLSLNPATISIVRWPLNRKLPPAMPILELEVARHGLRDPLVLLGGRGADDLPGDA